MKKSMLRGLVLSAIAAGTFAFSAQSTEAAVQINPINNISSDFIKGADVSMLPEMEKLVSRHYAGKKDDMIRLADRRAQAVKNWLMEQGW